jgi:RNA polymerase sigma-70 factor (ECF subfamily)
VSAEVLRLRAREGAGTPLSDEAVARACAGGDAGAVTMLFDRFHPSVTRFVRWMIGTGPDVEDLVQSTFLEVARGGASFDETRGGVRTWLFAIATNVVRHHRRSNARRARLLTAVSWSVERTVDDLHDRTDARARARLAQEGLESLSEELRDAFVLCELTGVSAREAGAILGTSEVAVWKRVSKARAAVRAYVERGGP